MCEQLPQREVDYSLAARCRMRRKPDHYYMYILSKMVVNSWRNLLGSASALARLDALNSGAISEDSVASKMCCTHASRPYVNYLGSGKKILVGAGPGGNASIGWCYQIYCTAAVLGYKESLTLK